MLTVNYLGDATHGSSSGATRITIVQRPSAKITSPTGGHTYEVGQLVHTRFSCREGPGGAGIASCKDSNGASSPHGSLNTHRTGRHTYTVTATSRDGLKRRVSISYTVVARHRRRSMNGQRRVVAGNDDVTGSDVGGGESLAWLWRMLAEPLTG